jgi:glucokinase
MDRGLGIDLGGTNVRAAVVDRSTGALMAVQREPLVDRSPEAVTAVTVGVVRAAAKAAGTDPSALGRVGCGVAGQCLGDTGTVINAPNLGWRDVPFGPMLAKALGGAVRMVNDLSAAAWGELQFGAARGASDVALVFVGSGVGCGLILGGQLHQGAGGIAGELGHTKVQTESGGVAPRRCGCGELGCLEAYLGGVALAGRVREELGRGAVSSIRDRVEGGLGRVGAAAVEAAYVQGDTYAVALWEELGELLGMAIANLITLLNPARVVLGGGVLSGCPSLVEIATRWVQSATSRSALAQVTLVPSRLGDDAGVIGAAILPGR